VSPKDDVVVAVAPNELVRALAVKPENDLVDLDRPHLVRRPKVTDVRVVPEQLGNPYHTFNCMRNEYFLEVRKPSPADCASAHQSAPSSG
jgi:hypothetical protein